MQQDGEVKVWLYSTHVDTRVLQWVPIQPLTYSREYRYLLHACVYIVLRTPSFQRYCSAEPFLAGKGGGGASRITTLGYTISMEPDFN